MDERETDGTREFHRDPRDESETPPGDFENCGSASRTVGQAVLDALHHLAMPSVPCERAGMTDALGRVLNNLASTEMIEDAAAAMATGRRAIVASRRTGQQFILGISTGTYLESALLTGQWDTSLAELAALDFDPFEARARLAPDDEDAWAGCGRHPGPTHGVSRRGSV